MDIVEEFLAFGPVPSRRLGRSVGVNNIPPKICTYSCVYCQLGRTLRIRVEREVFFRPERIIKSVLNKVKEAEKEGELIDYLTFVPDGEPTLDKNLGKEIELVKDLGIKTAVITNASLMWREDVREDLCKVDWVSVKVDAASPEVWHRVNRGERSLDLDRILGGIQEFAKNFSGELNTETMLVKNINDSIPEIDKMASFIAGINPKRSYLALPTRPPAEKWVRGVEEKTLYLAYRAFSSRFINTEYLIGYEGNAFAFTGNPREDLLSITSVHPMREDAVEVYLKKAKEDWGVVEDLVKAGELVKLNYGGKRFFLRKLRVIK